MSKETCGFRECQEKALSWGSGVCASDCSRNNKDANVDGAEGIKKGSQRCNTGPISAGLRRHDDLTFTLKEMGVTME